MSRSEESLSLSGVAAADALAAVAVAAEEWGALWQPDGGGGSLALPVSAGLRQGVVEARVEVQPQGKGCRLSLEVERESYRLHSSAVFILVVGGAGAIASTLWPFFPRLLAVAPFGIVLALSAWLLVAGRLRNAGTVQFLELISAHLGEEPEPAQLST